MGGVTTRILPASIELGLRPSTWDVHFSEISKFMRAWSCGPLSTQKKTLRQTQSGWGDGQILSLPLYLFPSPLSLSFFLSLSLYIYIYISFWVTSVFQKWTFTSMPRLWNTKNMTSQLQTLWKENFRGSSTYVKLDGISLLISKWTFFFKKIVSFSIRVFLAK